MTENEIIEKLKGLKAVEPQAQWKNWLKSQILASFKAEKAEFQREKPKAKVASQPLVLGFSFYRYRWVAASLILVLSLTATGVLAQKATPYSFLYPVKKATQALILKLTPDERRPALQLAFTEDKINALNHLSGEAKIKLQAEIKNDLKETYQQITKIDKPSRLLAISQELDEKTKKIEEKAQNHPEIESSISQTRTEILTLIENTQKLSTNCPNYLNNILEQLKNNPLLEKLTPSQIAEISRLMGDAQTALMANVCVDALYDLEAINRIAPQLGINLTGQNSTSSAPAVSSQTPSSSLNNENLIDKIESTTTAPSGATSAESTDSFSTSTLSQ